VNADTGWAVSGAGIVLRSVNGGLAWSFAPTGFDLSFNSVFFADPLNGWAVGAQGIIMHYTDESLSAAPQGGGTSTRTALPADLRLTQNYPNPFNPSTTIRFSLPENAAVRLTVYDLLGREVASLVDGALYAAGDHQVRFEADGLPAGVYFARLSTGTGGRDEIMKMLLLK
jgi:hypothetical protein